MTIDDVGHVPSAHRLSHDSLLWCTLYLMISLVRCLNLPLGPQIDEDLEPLVQSVGNAVVKRVVPRYNP